LLKTQDRQDENRTNCICGIFIKKDFRAFPAYNPALSYSRIPVQIVQFTCFKASFTAVELAN